MLQLLLCFVCIYRGATIGPDITASCCFVISGYLSVIEATHKWYPDIEMNNTGWWAAWNNTLGGIGFLLNGVLFIWYPGLVPSTIPLLIGSIFFLIGSYISWYEQCKT